MWRGPASSTAGIVHKKSRRILRRAGGSARNNPRIVRETAQRARTYGPAATALFRRECARNCRPDILDLCPLQMTAEAAATPHGGRSSDHPAPIGNHKIVYPRRPSCRFRRNVKDPLNRGFDGSCAPHGSGDISGFPRCECLLQRLPHALLTADGESLDLANPQQVAS